MQNRTATSQTLAYLLQEKKVLRAREDKLPSGVGLIDDPLNIREQLRHALCFVEDNLAGELVQKSPRVTQRKNAMIRILQRNVAVFGEGCANQRRFAGLPGPSQRDDGILPGRGLQSLGKVSGDHDPAPCNMNFQSSHYAIRFDPSIDLDRPGSSSTDTTVPGPSHLPSTQVFRQVSW